MSPSSNRSIPVLRPQLPTADALLPYLRRVDGKRVYSNQGPLSLEFERRMCEFLNVEGGSFVAASNGTSALAAAVLATAGRATHERPLAAIPAFTFAATASAVEQCGYIPHLIDVDPASWAMQPEAVLESKMLDRMGVVVPVAPYGRPQSQKQWQTFQKHTAISVVFDGAASFDRLTESQFLGELPVALSFSATKSFATGEGGAVATNDLGLGIRIRRALNFGFFLARESRSPSINGKMSEYHAAVGLAELDGWTEKQKALQDVAERYRTHAKRAGIAERIITTPSLSSSYVLFAGQDDAEAVMVQAALSRQSIGSRLWYGTGLHREPYFASLSRETLDVTDHLAPTLLGIPLAPDLSEEEIASVVGLVAYTVQAKRRVEGGTRA
ncbi:MAG: DegT/DnrJ/EryC1/StrS family aminotransferase [Candidatus Eremiobacteraeota bacterium]|nr:DegT/DnrJ/EryC1/StrS family aminotransferase [Candidatus Eremiobacteraeota bacterium]